MQIDIDITEPRWAALDLPALAQTALGAVLADRGVGGQAAVSLLACDDARIAQLNADHRGKPQPTNVLSWPAGERGAAQAGAEPEAPVADIFGEVELGDIAIAWQTCEREAAEQGKPLADHVTHLIVHAGLHLLGYDHLREADALLMESIEIRILETMGIVNPYVE